MNKLLAWLQAQFASFAIRRQMNRQIDPHVFSQMADELKSLAFHACRVCPGETEMQAKIREIHAEAEHLARMAQEPDFKRIPAKQRFMLRQGLLQSRRQLLESIQDAPSPTRLLQ
ncbi:MAG: hypothetical protein V3573_05815 [Desulfovibrionaceae bacterium]